MIGKSIKLIIKVLNISNKSIATSINFSSKKLAKTTKINPYYLLTENRKDIDYKILFLKEVIRKKIKPKKTLYYNFLLGVNKSPFPEKICENFLKLYKNIKQEGIKEPIYIAKYPKDTFMAKYFYNGREYGKKYRNKAGYQLFDGSKRLAITIFENYKSVPCKIFRPIGFEIPDYTSYIDKNKVLILSLRKNPQLQQLHETLNAIFHKYSNKIDQVSRGNFYQGLKSISIAGQRNTEQRFKIYGIGKYLQKNHTVLDIGSNCGFFSLYVSKFVRSLDSIEKDGDLVKIANNAKKYLGIKNCIFHQSAFEQFKPSKKYDLIMSFAVHRRVNYQLEEYLDILHNMLNKHGYLVIESQDIKGVDANFAEDMNKIIKRKYIMLKKGTLNDDRINDRIFMVLRKV